MTELLPLSTGQQALWFLHQIAPGSAAYNVGITIRVRSEIDVAALDQAVTMLVDRHDVLRSRFVATDGQPQRQVTGPGQAHLLVTDLFGRNPEQLRTAVRAALAVPFSLSEGAPFRAMLFRRTQTDAVLLLAAHHIITDFASHGMLLRELLDLYAAINAGGDAELPPLAATYNGHVIAEQQLLSSPRGAELAQFWSEACHGMPIALDLPADHPRPPVQPYSGETHESWMPAGMAERLRAQASKAAVTPFTFALATFQSLLYRYTGQPDFAVGCPTTPARARELTGIAGYFVNPVVIRASIDGQLTFRQVLEDTHRRVVQALRHQEYPLALVLAQLRVPADASRSPGFQVAFGLQGAHMGSPLLEMVTEGEGSPGGSGSLSYAGLLLDPFDIPQQEGQFDLAMELIFSKTSLKAVFRYRNDLFDPATIHQLAAHFRSMLDAVLSEPDLEVSQIPLIDASEGERLRALSAGVNTELPATSAHELVVAQAAATPEAIAVTGPGFAWTYSELNRRSRSIASLLRVHGVRPGDRVGVCLRRSPDEVAAMLAVMMADAIYLPLDPDYPAERLEFMISDAAPRLVLTSAGTAGRLPGTAVLLTLDDGVGAGPDASPGSPATATPDDVAYMIYTSGSTGHPKGVLLSHRGLANLAWWQRDYFRLRPGSVVLRFASASFDASVWEIVMALTSGAALYISPPEVVLTGADLAAVIRDGGVTHATLPPSVLATIQPDEVPALAHVVTAGEECPADLVRAWAADRALYNAYGPTEATVCATIHRCSRDEGRPPIGRPLANVRAYVVDESLGLVPRGVLGELVIGGASVAYGYHQRPELTARHFTSDHLGDGQRLYRTGDRVRMRADGELEFFGRIDSQTKIRGFRIELGEVESALRRHPGVRDAVVVAVGDGTARRLAGYFVPAGQDPAPSSSELRGQLARSLPEYMIPATLSAIGSIPLTPNGKVDRAGLAEMPAVPVITEAAAPRTPLEKTLSEIWASVLELPAVGIHDSFFTLGGHSLLAARLADQVRQRLGAKIQLRQLLERPTVAGLAEMLTAPEHANEPLPRIVPTPAGQQDPFPLTDIQQAYLLGRGAEFELGGVSAHGYYEIAGADLDPGRLAEAWNTIVTRHPMLRAVFDGNGTQRVLAEVPPYEITCADKRHATTAQAVGHLESVRDEMTHQVLQADTWPLFDIRQSLLPGGESRLHLSFDGLIVDGASLRKILHEWAALYADPAQALPELSITFRDYMLAWREIEDGNEYSRSRDYWIKRAESLPDAPALPLAIEPTAIRSPRFEQLRARLDAAAWQQLRHRAADAGISPPVILLTAYAECLAAWSRTRHFTLNLTTFDRLPMHPQVDSLVGDFTSLTLLEVDFRQPATLTERARNLQAQLWEDLDHRHFSGVRVLRERTRRSQAGPAAPMPVVFTSTFGSNDEGWGFERFGELVAASSQTPQVWLDHVVVEHGGALDLIWNVVPELFPPGMPEDMFERYASLAIELADSDAAWTRRFKDLRPAAHRAEHLAANATQTEWAQPLLLHGMFRSRAISHPEAPAVIDDRITSYGELAAQANAVTVRLRELGVRPGELVAVAMGKGREQVAAVIGILQARAAYLPVSIDLPAARRAFLLADARVRVVLSRTRDQALITTDQAEKSAVGAGEPYRWPTVVTVDDMRPVPELPGDAHAVLQSDLAYIIYTSGSTGQPKGVMIDHAGAANTILDINERFGITASDRAIAVSELNFDLSVYDIFGMLAAGGAIVMPQPGHDADPRHWADLVSRHGVTVWNSVPALMQLLVEHQESRSNSELASLRRVLLSGDWIPVTLPGRVTRQFPAAKVISLGGATEASIWSIFHDVDDSDAKRASIPYGRPLANQAFHVLDECLEARPTWVPGELYIGGAGVALGYWADEQRSTERFIRHPASGERIYRTGDFGRYLPGGEIEFLGRDDSQVKVNGHRVELGEIESTLLQHQEVTAAVAFAPQIDGRRRLVGYVVPATGVPGAGAQAHGSLHRLVRAEAADCAAVWERVTAAADHHVREARMDASMAQFGQFEQAVETLSTAAIRDTLHKLGLFGRSGDHLDLDSVLDAGRVAGRYRRLISQWLAALTDDGVLISDNGGYRAAEPLGPVDLQSRWTAVAAAASWGPHADRLVGYLRQAVDQLVPLLQGDADPLEVLFEGGDLAVADSLYRNNPVLDSCNEIAGKSVDALCAGWTGGRPLRVLELGAGTGGMTASVLPRLLDRPVSYTYTDVSRFLLDRAGERFAKYPFLDFRYLDVNVPPWQQGYQAHDYDVVLAANVLHDAHEVTRSLSWVRELIVPGGVLVMVEGTSNSRLQLVSLGLIEGLSAYQDSRAEGNQPLLNAAEWAANLHAAGFTRTHAVSGSPTAQALQQSVLIAQSPSEAAAFDPQLVRQYLRTQLPDYMIPGTIVRLDALPLSSNGKVRRTELPLPPADTSLRGSRSENSAAPESAVQRIIAAVWQQALAIPEPGLHDSFFALGGDSLVATKVVARLREEFAIELRIREMFDAGTIARLSVLIERRRTAATAAGTGSAVAENDDNEWIEEEI